MPLKCVQINVSRQGPPASIQIQKPHFFLRAAKVTFLLSARKGPLLDSLDMQMRPWNSLVKEKRQFHQLRSLLDSIINSSVRQDEARKDRREKAASECLSTEKSLRVKKMTKLFFQAPSKKLIVLGFMRHKTCF